jgi:hypothetical protein
MALSGIELSAGIVVGVSKSVDGKYGPYPDLATAKSEIASNLRYLGLTVGIETSGTVEEYWWESGTADGDLVAKGGGGGGGTWGSITGTLSDQTDLQSALDGKVDENTAITGATKTKITYDAKGLVTAGEDLTASDLPSSIDATKIADGSVTNAEFQYLGSVTSDIQTQVDAKTPKLISLNAQTGTTYTLILGDADKLVEMNNAAANTLTVPPNSSVAFSTGTQIIVVQKGAGTTTIAAGSGVTLLSKDSALGIGGQYGAATCIKIATDTWYVIGDLA